jgi:insertion element IS1 protein InsB
MVKRICYHCGSDHLACNGLTQNGKQRHLCSDCGRTSRADPQPNGATRPQSVSESFAPITSAAVCVGCLAPLASPDKPSPHGSKKEMTLPELSETLIEPDPAEPATSILELDELWSFVLKRANKRWVWIALCRTTRQVVAYVVGDRSRATYHKLWQQIPTVYRSVHCRERLLGSISIGYSRRTTHCRRQRQWVHCTCRKMEQHLAAKTWTLRQKESLVLQV